MVPSRAPDANTSNADPTLATKPTRIAVATQTSGSPSAKARPSFRSASSASRVSAPADVLEVGAGRRASAIEILEFVIELGVVGVTDGRAAGCGSLRRRVVPPPSTDQSADPERAQRDARHRDDPNRAKRAVVRRNCERLGSVLGDVLRQDLIARLSCEELRPNLLPSFFRRLARARRQQITRARSAHAANGAEDGPLGVVLDMHRAEVDAPGMVCAGACARAAGVAANMIPKMTLAVTAAIPRAPAQMRDSPNSSCGHIQTTLPEMRTRHPIQIHVTSGLM